MENTNDGNSDKSIEINGIYFQTYVLMTRLTVIRLLI